MSEVAEVSSRRGYRSSAREVPELIFEDPPLEAPRPEVDWDSVAERLRARPGRWARVNVPGWAWSLNSACSVVCMAPMRPRGSFQAVARNGSLWVRATPWVDVDTD